MHRGTPSPRSTVSPNKQRSPGTLRRRDGSVLPAPCRVPGLSRGLSRVVPELSPSRCEKFLYGFQGGPPGRSRRRHGAPGLRSRWRSRYGRANAGRLARKAGGTGRLTYSKFHLCRRGVPAPAAGIVRGRSEPVKAVCDRRTTASVELLGERTREDGLD